MKRNPNFLVVLLVLVAVSLFVADMKLPAGLFLVFAILGHLLNLAGMYNEEYPEEL